jgi:N-methylhydantoinase A
MKTTIVPPNPGNLSAFGLLAVDWRTDHIVTKLMHEGAIDLAAVAAIYAALEAEATATLEKDGIPSARITLLREADVRYAGQSMEVRVPAPSGAIDAQFVAGLTDAFHAAHLKTFGYNYAGQQKVEVVNFCVSAFGLIDRPHIPELKKNGAPAQPVSRSVYFDGQFHDTPVFARASLPAGFTFTGPAIVEEFGSTSVVFAGQKLSVDPHGILIIRAAGRSPSLRA